MHLYTPKLQASGAAVHRCLSHDLAHDITFQACITSLIGGLRNNSIIKYNYTTTIIIVIHTS